MLQMSEHEIYGLFFDHTLTTENSSNFPGKLPWVQFGICRPIHHLAIVSSTTFNNLMVMMSSGTTKTPHAGMKLH